MRVDQGLAGAAGRFIDEVGAAMEQIAAELTDVDASKVRTDVVVEAFNLAAGFVDCDGLETDDELWAFIAAFAPHAEYDLAKARPADLRDSGMITGKHEWLATPSTLFQILLGVDSRTGSRHATVYYGRALEIAHMVASLDDHVSRTELEFIERYRSMLLAEIGRAPADERRPAPGGPTAAAPTAAVDAPPAPDELPPPRPLDELLAELDALVGLAEVKAEVKLVADLISVQNLRRARELPTLETSRHLVFVGNPGTGKTTVARLVAEIYRTLGVVTRGHLVETDRAGLVAGFVGQTATKVMEVFQQADGGVLLIDEAYALVRGGDNDFGREAIDTIVKVIEDRRDSVVVIVAGYPDEMGQFIDSNPGLRSRFPKTIDFPDYSTDELVAIFESNCERSRYELAPEARVRVRAWLDAFPRGKGFGNGRLARNLFEDAVGRQASRVVAMTDPTDQQLLVLIADDIAAPGDGPAHHEAGRPLAALDRPDPSVETPT